ESVGEFLDHDRKNPMRVTGDRRRQLERARPCLESRTMVAPTRRRGGLGVARAHRRCARPTSPREYDRQIIVATRVSQWVILCPVYIRFNRICDVIRIHDEPFPSPSSRWTAAHGRVSPPGDCMRRETIAIHGGYDVDPTTRAVAVPIYQTVAYAFDSADHGAALFNLEVEGFRYSRISNPTTEVLERRVAALEGGREALCVSTGQAALNYAALNVTELGSNIVSVPQLYGTTYTLFAYVLPSQGVTVRFAASDRPDAIEKLIDDNTRAVFCESVGNPAGNICDITALAEVAHRHGVPLIVDNTVATPILLKPIEHGADVVVHSLTKFMGGHGTTLGGIIVDSGKFPWREHADRFPMFNRPDASYHGLIYVEHFKEAAYIARCRSVYQRTTGAVLPPLSAFLLLQGIETVALRVERHVENARRVAEFLRGDARVAWVSYAGFPDSPYHGLAQR